MLQYISGASKSLVKVSSCLQASRIPVICTNYSPSLFSFSAKRCYAAERSNQNLMKVTIVGAAGTMGQCLALMLKQCPLIDEVCLYDLRATRGNAKELRHIDTKAKVTAFMGKDNIKKALKDAKIIVIIAARRHKGHLDYDSMFKHNAPIIKDIVQDVAEYNPKAFLAICTNPVNSLVPVASEILKKCGRYNPKTIFGVTTIDSVRANTLVAQTMGIPPECVTVPVIGGHTEETIVPVLSNAKPCAEFTNAELEEITVSVKKGHRIIVKIKKNEGAKLAEAFSTARFVISLVKAQQGVSKIIECCFVKSSDNRVRYLATPVLIGPAGVARNLGIPELSEYEGCQMENAIEVLKEDIKQGELYMGIVHPPKCDICDEKPNVKLCPPDPCMRAR